MKMGNAPVRAQGEARRSQMIGVFGPGSMLDLPSHSVLVGGLDVWSSAGRQEIMEPRLSSKLASLLEIPAVRLLTPPVDAESQGGIPTGIDCFQFPEWFLTQDEETGTGETTRRARLLVHRNALVKGRYVDREKRRLRVVPVRFVRACRAGHIGDLDWYAFVHGRTTDCAAQYRQLRVEERGTASDLSDVYVCCGCGAERSMLFAADLRQQALGRCDGSRPWLGRYNTRESCGEPNRLLIRTASNAYFPLNLVVISLPDRNETVKAAVAAAWEYLEAAESADDVRYERKKARVRLALEGVTDEEAFREILIRRGDTGEEDKPVKVAELETLLASTEEVGEDRPHGNFYARTLPRPIWDAPWMAAIQRVVLVHRLREVVAQVGFTRFEPAAPNALGELEMGVLPAALAREIEWLPAIENKGEGVFLQFKDEAIAAWLARPAVQDRGRELEQGFDVWRREHQGSQREFPGLPYLMLHSFAHLLITVISLECGYAASAIRERIYAIPGVGYGVLLYTGTADAEGTLGGLIQAARRIQEFVAAVLELGGLCSNDPVCAQHAPDSAHEQRFLHGAACHGCVLIAETSCEQQNDFLDRALVVATLDGRGAEFFAADPA